MTTRSRKENKVYRTHIKNVHKKTKCIFCDLKEGDAQFIKETKSFKIVKNAFPYSFWDNQTVIDHIMILPKKHVDSISSFTAQESIEFVDILSSYELQGYNIWARSPKSILKSVIHQHTHLIKPGNKRWKFLFYIHKPNIRIAK